LLGHANFYPPSCLALFFEFLFGYSFDLPQTAMFFGDSISLSIAAASIVAKVARDRLLVALDFYYPQYAFGRHKGYGTAAHRQALQWHGVTPIHRRSFRPVAGLLQPALRAQSSPHPGAAQPADA